MIEAITSSSSSSNCYLVWGRRACLIDAGLDSRPALMRIKALGISLDYLTNTHVHYDHIGADQDILDATGAKLCLFKEAADVFGSGDEKRTLSGLFGRDFPMLHADIVLDEGDVIDLGGVRLEIVHTPGHSSESICLYEPKTKSLFSGDTVFAGGIGRCDLPSGDMMRLGESLKKLIRLHEEKGIDVIYPGHGGPASGDDLEIIYSNYF